VNAKLLGGNAAWFNAKYQWCSRASTTLQGTKLTRWHSAARHHCATFVCTRAICATSSRTQLIRAQTVSVFTHRASISTKTFAAMTKRPCLRKQPIPMSTKTQCVLVNKGHGPLSTKRLPTRDSFNQTLRSEAPTRSKANEHNTIAPTRLANEAIMHLQPFTVPVRGMVEVCLGHDGPGVQGALGYPIQVYTVSYSMTVRCENQNLDIKMVKTNRSCPRTRNKVVSNWVWHVLDDLAKSHRQSISFGHRQASLKIIFWKTP
jgi:hypothetical protein